MNRNRGLLPLLVAAVVLLAALGLVTRGYASPAAAVAPAATEPEMPAAVPAVAADPGVDRGDPAAVCQAFTTALLTLDAGEGTGDSHRLAAAYATADLAAALLMPTRQRPPGSLRSGATVTVDPHVGDQVPADTADAAHRAFQATVTGTGWTELHIVYCTLRSADGIWLVAGYDRERSLA